MNKVLSALLLSGVSTAVMAVDIDHPHDRIEEKKNQSKEEIQKSIEHMEAELAAMKAKLSTQKKDTSLRSRFHFKGDLRLRYESIEREDYATVAGDANKYRNRYRIRLGSEIDFTENLHLEVGVRSGFANPTSGNQSFATDEPLKNYFFESLRFNVIGLSYEKGKSTFKAGRQPYMIYRPIKSQLIWDNDISLNGLNYQYKDSTKIITLGANQPTLEELSSARDTVNLIVAQYVHKMKLNDIKLNLGTGLYYYDGLKGNTPLFKGSRKGNTLDANGLYVNDYQMVEGFGELQFKSLLGKPFKVAAGFVYNLGAASNNFGYDLAFQFGKAKKVNEWQLKYSYTDLQDDATYGAYSDSDNFGGGTAAKGHAIRVKYKFGKNSYLAGNFFFNKHYSSNTKSVSPSSEPWYERVQLDAIFKF